MGAEAYVVLPHSRKGDLDVLSMLSKQHKAHWVGWMVVVLSCRVARRPKLKNSEAFREVEKCWDPATNVRSTCMQGAFWFEVVMTGLLRLGRSSAWKQCGAAPRSGPPKWGLEGNVWGRAAALVGI